MATDDLFGSDSDSGNDTDDLIASAKKHQPSSKATAGNDNNQKKKRLGAAKKNATKRLAKSNKAPIKKKNDIPDADNLFGDSSSDESDDNDNAGTISKKERMEALIRARKSRDGQESSAAKSSSRKDKKDASKSEQAGYESESSIRSSEFVRTKEDDDFIDAEDDDPDARRELYAEQHFDDEEAEEVDDVGKGRKKRKIRFDDDADLRRSKKSEEDADNPIMMAVSKMKKKKKEVKKLSELEDEAKEFVYKMMLAANDDEEEVKANRPALRKLAMLPSVVETAARREMIRPLLDNRFLDCCGQWIQPLPNGTLGNVTLRSELLRSIANMTGENGISTEDLKRSGFGKKVMSIYMHKDETPEMKRFLKQLIEQWSRPVFGLTGNMKDLEHAQRGRQGVGMASSMPPAYAMPSSSTYERIPTRDFSTIIAKGQVKGSRDLGNNRVRVPYSKGFQFTVRPENKAPTKEESKKINSTEDQREALKKRMLENSRVKSKNYRSVNLSLEGRATK